MDNEEIFENERPKYIDVEINHEMQKSFMDYAMSVNVSRAIPDVRDGLKPVHRRILYTMGHIMNLYSNVPYRKCAAIVGEVMGKFHPHGDSSVYDALVRLAQDFSIRCPLVDGHGNFGSVDGDPAAAMRYTEARLSKIASEMLRDLDKESVDFMPNYDETLLQPVVLPSRFPNLLVNGSDGIAVGMATNIPPHNLNEVIDCVTAMIDNPEITVDELIDIMPAPDYPTGGIIMGRSAIRHAYRTGRGGIVIRAKTEIEEENGKEKIVVTELPYQVNKAKLIEYIADLVKDKRIEGISDIKDESDREGLRIVIDVKREANANVVLNTLFKHTNLQVSAGIILLALADGMPRLLNLREIIYYYLEHQREVIRRRTQFDLKKAQEREHIVDGLVIALANIDEVIAIIKASNDKVDASTRLQEAFELTEIQTNAILDMRLQKLTSLEVEKLKQELEELKALIAEYQSILANPAKVDAIIRDEIVEIKEKYGTPRRTEISIDYGDIDIEDLIPREDVVISMTHKGYIKRLSLSEYKSQNRGGKGVIGHKPKEEDFVEKVFIANSHSDLFFFTNFGKVYSIRAYEVPESQKNTKGRAIVNILNLAPEEHATTIMQIDDRKADGYLVMATKKGYIKKTKLSEFERINHNGKIAISLREDDELINVELADGNSNVIVTTSNGRCIRFHEDNVRPMGRTAIGVRAIRLFDNAEVIDMILAHEDDEVLTISELGIGKRMKVSDIRITRRGGKGVRAGKFNTKTGNIVGLKKIDDTNDVIVISVSGTMIRFHADALKQISRLSYGVRIMRLKGNDVVSSFAITTREEEQPEIDENGEQSQTEVIENPTFEQLDDNDGLAVEDDSDTDEEAIDEEINEDEE